MTAIRKSYLIAPETSFGSGVPKDGKWYPVPQGFYLSWNGSTQASSLYGTGAKIRQNSIYGQFQGSWSASYVMDFNNLEFLSIIFDAEDNSSPEAIDSTDNTKANFLTDINGVYEHRFVKINSRRQKSFVIKERVLNIIAGGSHDEENLLKGVLARNIQGARSTSGSQMALEMSGVFADKNTTLFDTRLDSFFVPIKNLFHDCTNLRVKHVNRSCVCTKRQTTRAISDAKIWRESAISCHKLKKNASLALFSQRL